MHTLADRAESCSKGDYMMTRSTPSDVATPDAQAAVVHLHDTEFVLRPAESHLGGFAAADEVLDFIRGRL